jgi:hypothetical protein
MELNSTASLVLIKLPLEHALIASIQLQQTQVLELSQPQAYSLIHQSKEKLFINTQEEIFSMTKMVLLQVLVLILGPHHISSTIFNPNVNLKM